MHSNPKFQIPNPKSTISQRSFVPKGFSRLLLPLIVFVALALSFAGAQWQVAKAAAMTFVVNTTNDTLLAGACAAATPGQCSLREAIVEANANPGADTIATSVTGTINLTSALPDITEDVTINGPGASLLTVRRDTGGDYRIFKVTTGGTVTFFGLTVSNGNATGTPGGGGILNASGGTVNVTNSRLSGNSAGTGGGGGIYNSGTLNVTNSTLSGNSAGTGEGGGIANAGGTVNVTNSTLSGNFISVGGAGAGITNGANGGTLNVTNSTLSGNLTDSNGVGGGIANGSGTVNVTNSTLSGNSAGFGGGIDNLSGTVKLSSSIVALNTALNGVAPNPGPDLHNTITSLGYNVVGTTSGATIVATTGDQFGVTAIQLKLDPLGNNGGPTQTMALQAGSVAIDQGINSKSLLRDQRGPGFDRTFDDPTVVNATGGDGTDVGAFEAQPPNQLPVAKCKNIQISANSSCMASITAADVNDGSFDPDAGDTITLTLDNSGPFGLGAHTVTLTVTDQHGASSSCTATVTVVDTTPPTISGESVNPSELWPPNHKMVLVTVNYTTSDNCGSSSVLSVSSDEGTSEDWEIVDAHHVKLRAERLGNGDGRIYTITITSTDSSGNSTSKTVIVTVPHDQGARVFVRHHFLDFLNREPDESGFDFWTNQITSCGSDQPCIEVRQINVSAAFYLSIEFRGTGYLVERMYKAAYGDANGNSTFGGAHQLAVPIVRFDEFLLDTQKIGQDVVVGRGNWERQLEANKQAFAAEFVQRSRFTTAYPTSLTPTQFVNQLFANAGVTPSAPDLAAAVAEFGEATNTSDVSARERAFLDVAENSILDQQESNRAFVLMQYFGYLRRNPNDTPDSDYTGYDFWLTKLNRFSGNFIEAEMVKAFITSFEYQQRFEQ
jgi:CSLREA domain-containing protein